MPPIPESYRPGDVVVANRDVYGVREGEAWTVTGSSRERVELTRKGTDGGFRPSGNASRNLSVFETRPLSLRAGDEIVFTRNLKKRKIINGERRRSRKSAATGSASAWHRDGAFRSGRATTISVTSTMHGVRPFTAPRE